MAAVTQSRAKDANFVGQDTIWKCHVQKEVEAARKWPEEWGFLTTPFTEVENEEKEEYRKSGRETAEDVRLPSASPLEKSIKVEPSPPVPQTTQGLVGWRSSVPSLQLERYGKAKHMKGDFCKRMNWPAEGIA
ncbi:ciliary microtubule inner protein 1 [Mantella aurantiaca]